MFHRLTDSTQTNHLTPAAHMRAWGNRVQDRLDKQVGFCVQNKLAFFQSKLAFVSIFRDPSPLMFLAFVSII